MRAICRGMIDRPRSTERIELPMPSHRTLAERFWSKVEFTDTCWLWRGKLDRYGYGQFTIGRRAIGAHRWAYEFCVGPIREGLQTDHLCSVRSCVAPFHLELVTTQENTARYYAGWTHCRNGHEIKKCGYIKNGIGRRTCRKCSRERMRRFVKRNAPLVGGRGVC